MALYNVFESTNMQSTGHGSKRIFDVVADVDIENGTFGYLNGLADGFSHIYNFAKGTKDGEVVIVADQPAWDEDECRRTNQRRDKFVIKAGTPFRARVVAINDEFAIAIQGVSVDTRSLVLDATDYVATEVYVTIDAEGKLVASNTKTDNETFEGRVMRKRIIGGVFNTPIQNYGYSYAMYTVRVISAKGGNC
jgi:hypothetical protein